MPSSRTLIITTVGMVLWLEGQRNDNTSKFKFASHTSWQIENNNNVIGVVKMGKIVPRAVIEPTSLAFWAGVLTITPPTLPDVTHAYLPRLLLPWAVSADYYIPSPRILSLVVLTITYIILSNDLQISLGIPTYKQAATWQLHTKRRFNVQRTCMQHVRCTGFWYHYPHSQLTSPC